MMAICLYHRALDVPLSSSASVETLCLVFKALGRLLRWSVTVSAWVLRDPSDAAVLLERAVEAAGDVLSRCKEYASSAGREGKAALAGLYTSTHKVPPLKLRTAACLWSPVTRKQFLRPVIPAAVDIQCTVSLPNSHAEFKVSLVPCPLC
jgi:hypothetical protein